MERKNKMAVMPIPQLLLNMSVPLMFSLLIQSLYNIVDGIFVARLSEDALTATSLAYPVQILMIAVAIGTAIGVNALLSRLLGEKNDAEARKVAAMGLFLSLASALVFCTAGILFSRKIVSVMTDDATIANLCGQYLFICMVFCFGTFAETMFQRFLQASGKTLLSMVSLVIGAMANIILDPIMIFGYFGCPAMGIRGAAIATVIGQWLGAAAACLLNCFFNPEVSISLKDWRVDWDIAAKIYKVGAPTMITQGSQSVMVAAINAILAPHSTSSVAFFGVYYKLQNFLFMPINGLGQACLPIIGYNYGMKNTKRIKDVFRAAIPAAACIALIATAVFLAFPGVLLSIFSPSAEMLSLGIPALRIISVTFAFASVTMILGYIMSGFGNGFINMTGTLIRQLAILIPAAYLLSRFAGMGAIWFAFWISETAALAYVVLASKKELKKSPLN